MEWVLWAAALAISGRTLWGWRRSGRAYENANEWKIEVVSYADGRVEYVALKKHRNPAGFVDYWARWTADSEEEIRSYIARQTVVGREEVSIK